MHNAVKLAGDAVLGVVAGQLAFSAHPNSSTEALNDEKTKLVRSAILDAMNFY